MQHMCLPHVDSGAWAANVLLVQSPEAVCACLATCVKWECQHAIHKASASHGNVTRMNGDGTLSWTVHLTGFELHTLLLCLL